MNIEKLFEDKDYSVVVSSVQTMIEATTIISGRYNFIQVMGSINDLLEITEKVNTKKFTDDQKEYFNKCVIRGLIRIKEKILEGYIIDEEINFIDNVILKIKNYCKSC
jgi:hypothetical protein